MVKIDKNKPVTGEIYHVFTKSIAGFRIFNDTDEFLRIKEISRYYQQKDLSLKFSRFKQRFARIAAHRVQTFDVALEIEKIHRPRGLTPLLRM